MSVEDKGAELFTEFINYVAEKGYIEDNPAVKNLFAYRLTGYYRPEGGLPPIVWNGRNGKSYELIHIPDIEFKRKMTEFYPSVCEFKK